MARPDILLDIRSSQTNEAQVQIGYTITIGGQKIGIPEVWVNIDNDKTYFDQPVGTEIMDKIFKIQHPKEYQIQQLARLLGYLGD